MWLTVNAEDPIDAASKALSRGRDPETGTSNDYARLEIWLGQDCVETFTRDKRDQ
jgi:hypothetical protein